MYDECLKKLYANLCIVFLRLFAVFYSMLFDL